MKRNVEAENAVSYQDLVMEVMGVHREDLCQLGLTEVLIIDALIKSVCERFFLAPRRSEKIIRLRFGLDGERATLENTGKDVNLSRERTRQIERRIILRLRHPYYGKYLRHLFRECQCEERKIAAAEKMRRLQEYKDREVMELELTVRAYNVMKNAGINTIGELVQLEEYEFLKLKDAGRKTLNVTKEALAAFGLHFSMKL